MKTFQHSLVWICFLLLSRPFTGYGQSVIVTEIMYQPVGEQPEWIELYNVTDSTICLAGWEMSDSRADFITLTDENVQLPPKGLQVIAANGSLADFYAHQMEVIEPIGRFPGLNNSGDAIVLRDKNHDLVDSLYYETTWGKSPGISLERNWPADPIAWAESMAIEGATPGLSNSSWPVHFDLAVTSLIFDPAVIRAPGQTLVAARVKNDGLESANSFELIVFGDVNKNSTYDADDTEYDHFYGDFLAVGDSMDVFVEVVADTAGSYRIGADAIFEKDMRPENNRVVSDFRAGYPYESIFVNEIMYRPNPGQCEWVELYNPGTKTLNLRHWKLWDKTFSRAVEIDTDFFISANGFCVIAADSVFFTDVATESIAVYVPSRFPTLNNDFDQIILRDFAGLSCDSVLYYDVWGGGTAVSLERVSIHLNPFQAKAWQASSDPSGATPGRVNSSYDNGNTGIVLDTLFYAEPLQYGECLVVSGQITNLAEKEAPASTLKFYNEIIGDTVLVTPVATEKLASIAPGNSIVFQVELPLSPGGIRWLFLELEATGQQWGPYVFAAGEDTGVVSINEFMVAPRDGEPEWIELFNRRQEAVAINGWRIQGESDELPLSREGAIFIPPQGFLVVTGVTDFTEYWPNCECPVVNLGHAFPDLRNTADQIVLFDAAGEQMDSLAYDESWPKQTGFSLEKTSVNVSSGVRGSWAVCADFTGGTPCHINSMYASVMPDHIHLWPEPDIFSMDEDDAVTIHYQLPVPKATVDMKIFDVNGRLMRTLLSLAPSGMAAQVTWDGRDIEGKMVRMGIYVVFLEGLSEIEGWHETKTCPLVLAKEL